jgi:hypothetical protein
MRYIKIIHLISLDVALGAVLFQLYFCRLFLGNFPHWTQILLLFSSIWLIYLLDRRIDLQIQPPTDERHLFQFEHRKPINYLIALLFLLSIILTFYLPIALLKFGVFLVIGIALYWIVWLFGCFDHILASKEIFTAIYFTLGIGAVIFYQFTFCVFFIECFILFFLVVFHNLLIFSSLEINILRYWTYLIKWVELLFVIILVILISTNPSQRVFLNILPILITFCIQVWIHYFAYSLKSRLLGELAYFSPLIYFMYEFFSK